MKKFYLIPILLFSILQVFSQAENKYRYVNSVFAEVEIHENIEYATAPWLNNPITGLESFNIHNGESTTEDKALQMDIYEPKGDTVSRRPMIIFVHGGGFLLGSRHNEDMVAMCDSFARKGYVTATIDYRLGMGATVSTAIPPTITINESNASRAVYRGIQDGRAAVRFIKANAETYKIDTNNVFMVGSSAGGFVSLHNIYMNKDSEVPSDASTAPDLGSLDEIGITGAFNANADAIVPIWAAIQNTDLIVDEDIPSLYIHGTADQTVPFKDGKPLSTYSFPGVILNTPVTYGSFCIDTALTNRGIEHETYFVDGEDHEFYGVENGDFGVDGPNKYWDTVLTKTADFLHRQNKPVAGFTYTNTSETVKQFTDNSQNAVYWEWDFGDGTISNEEDPVHTFTKNGSYKVVQYVMNYNSSWDTTSTMVTVNYVGTTYDVTFNVGDGTDPISGAEVTLSGYGTVATNSSGVALFADVIPTADIEYIVKYEGYFDSKGKISVVDADVVETVELQELTYKVTFSVRTQGAKVELEGYDPEYTDQLGLAVFDSVYIENNIVYTITKDGYHTLKDSLDVVDEDVFVDSALQRIVFTVTFNVTDGSNALVGADVELGSYVSQVTNSSGEAVFSNVIPSVDLAYTVSLSGYNTVSSTITVDSDETENVTMTLITDVNDVFEKKVNIFPNPSTGIFNIDNGMNAKVNVFNVIGKLVYSGTLESQNDKIDLTSTPDGIYIIQINDGDKDVKVKVLKRNK